MFPFSRARPATWRSDDDPVPYFTMMVVLLSANHPGTDDSEDKAQQPFLGWGLTWLVRGIMLFFYCVCHHQVDWLMIILGNVAKWICVVIAAILATSFGDILQVTHNLLTDRFVFRTESISNPLISFAFTTSNELIKVRQFLRFHCSSTVAPRHAYWYLNSFAQLTQNSASVGCLVSELLYLDNTTSFLSIHSCGRANQSKAAHHRARSAYIQLWAAMTTFHFIVWLSWLRQRALVFSFSPIIPALPSSPS